MKNLKKILFGLAALVLAFGLVFSVSAFNTSKSTTAKKATIFYRYDANSMADIRNENQYSIVANPGVASCDAGTDLPCVIEVDESINTLTKLHDYLNDNTLFPSDEDITASTPYKKYAD